MASALAVSALAWLPCHRLIASRFPTVGLYDQVAAPEDLDVVFAIEALTNPRVRQELGQLSLVPPADRVAGPGATLIMAAFAHLNPLGSRFSDGSWGVYYAAESLDTAVAEVSHHRGAFLARTAEDAIDIDLRWIQADLMDRLHDLRGQGASMPAVYDPDRYGASQDLGRALRSQGSQGIVYDSVRRPQGQCVALFKPKSLSNARAVGHIGLHWDGRAISHWFDKGAPHVM
jgi:RES domain-containing protein